MMMITMVQTHGGHFSDGQLLDILAQFEGEESTAWGAMNAITAVARGTRDPERKWRLEEFGALVPARLGDPVRTGIDALEWEDAGCRAETRELVTA